MLEVGKMVRWKILSYPRFQSIYIYNIYCIIIFAMKPQLPTAKSNRADQNK